MRGGATGHRCAVARGVKHGRNRAALAGGRARQTRFGPNNVTVPEADLPSSDLDFD